MAFSTTSDFSQTGLDIVTEALELLGVLSEGEAPSSDQQTSSLRTLNSMLKLWSAEYNIFAQKDFYTLMTVNSQDQSVISGAKSHWDIMEQAEVGTAYTSTDTTLYITQDLAIGNYGYNVDSDTVTVYVFTSSAVYTANVTTSGVVDGELTLAAALGVDLSVGDTVWILPRVTVAHYPSKLNTLGIVDGSSAQYTELAEVAQGDLYRSQGASRPNTFYQKREAGSGSFTIRVNPAPDGYSYFLKGWAQYTIRDIDSIGDDVYFPQEWYLALSYGLAYLLAPKYGIHVSERDRLRGDMETFRWEASTYNTDGSIFFQPSTSNTTAFRRDDNGNG